MIDIHSHLLPGVDDGSKSIAMSCRVLEKFASQGVECVVLTPHLLASQAHSAPIERHRAILEELRAAAPQGIELRLGWEIMLDQPNADLRAPELALGESRAVLVEFPRLAVPTSAGDELERLQLSGVTPVLAHPERYWGCTVKCVEDWRAAGAVIQMDTAGLLGRGPISRVSRALVEAGLVDLFASDNHGDSRTLATAHAWLCEVSTPAHAELLTRTNALRLLAGEPIEPAPHLPSTSGIFARLREVFLGHGTH